MSNTAMLARATPARTSKCRHLSDEGVIYSRWHTDALERLDRNEKRTKCPSCRAYVWQYLYDAWEAGR